MFFNNHGKEISSKIKSESHNILGNFLSLHVDAVRKTKTEVEYFRQFFPAFQTFLNQQLKVKGVSFNVRAEEIHSSPLVTYGAGQTCELGDYIIVVKYKHNGALVGRKSIIYQLKRSHKNSWIIDQKQLILLKDWNTFNFGRRQNAANSFTVRPTRSEYGSFVLVNDLKHGLFESNIFGTAYDIFQNQTGRHVQVSDAKKFYYCGVVSYFSLLVWEIGEPIIPNTDISDFTSALYKYMGWEEGPPEEFVKYKKQGENNSFWGIEITVNSEGNQ